MLFSASFSGRHATTTGHIARTTAGHIARTTASLQLGHSRSDGLQGLHLLRLAVDGHLLRVDDVAQLQRTAVLELRTAEVVQLRRVGQVTDVDGLHDVVRVQSVHSGDVGHSLRRS